MAGKRKPIRVVYSTLSGRFYATQHYKQRPSGLFEITGEKFDVTDDIARAIKAHEIEFTPIEEKKGQGTDGN